MWSVFFLFPSDAAWPETWSRPKKAKSVLEWLNDLTRRTPYAIKTTEAPFFRRVCAQKSGTPPGEVTPMPVGVMAPHPTEHGARNGARPATVAGAHSRDAAPGVPLPGRIASFGVNDGRGFVFVDHLGRVCPSGFRPWPRATCASNPGGYVSARANVSPATRPGSLSRQVRRVRVPAPLRRLTRASLRATGDYLESDPYCTYVPAAHVATARSSRPPARPLTIPACMLSWRRSARYRATAGAGERQWGRLASISLEQWAGTAVAWCRPRFRGTSWPPPPSVQSGALLWRKVPKQPTVDARACVMVYSARFTRHDGATIGTTASQMNDLGDASVTAWTR